MPVGLKIKYSPGKDETAFQEYPVSGSIPVTQGNVTIPGDFDPSLKYAIKLEVFEGQLLEPSLETQIVYTDKISGMNL